MCQKNCFGEHEKQLEWKKQAQIFCKVLFKAGI